MLPGGGSYVSLMSPSGHDFSMIVETMDGQAAACAYEVTKRKKNLPLHIRHKDVYVQITHALTCNGF